MLWELQGQPGVKACEDRYTKVDGLRSEPLGRWHSRPRVAARDAGRAYAVHNGAYAAHNKGG